MVSKSDDTVSTKKKTVKTTEPKTTEPKTTKKTTSVKKTTVAQKTATPKKTVASKKSTTSKKAVASKVKTSPVKSVEEVMDTVVDEIVNYTPKEATHPSPASKQTQVKENILKSHEQKFAKQKNGLELSLDTDVSDEKYPSWAAWFRAYKNIFNYKGRTSFFEFWSFQFINMFLYAIFSIVSGCFVTETSVVPDVIILVITLMVFLTALSLSFRRIHSFGDKALNGYFLPLAVSGLISCVMLNYTADLSSHEPSLWLIIFNVLFLLAYLFYSIKVSVSTMFKADELQENQFGLPLYTEKRFVKKAWTYCYWFIFLSFVSVIIYMFYAIFQVLEPYMQFINELPTY